ncbi:phage antirepressor N-terminal domain-containing protein, partial [Klebsiella oxytoca]
MTSIAILEAINTSYVPFNGQQIITAMAAGIAYVAMKPVVENLGMSWGTQQQKLMKSLEKFNCIHMNMVAADGKLRKLLCLPLKKLNGWLFSINPEKVRADIRDKLIKYQEECFTVLHDYWTKGEVKNPRKKTTVDERTPLRDAVNMLVSKRHMMYPEAYAMIHQRFNVDSIEDLEVSQIPTAIEYVHRVALEGEFLGKQETLPAPKFDVNIPLQWWIDNNPLVRSGNLSFGRGCTAPALDVTMDMLCG